MKNMKKMEDQNMTVDVSAAANAFLPSILESSCDDSPNVIDKENVHETQSLKEDGTPKTFRSNIPKPISNVQRINQNDPRRKSKGPKFSSPIKDSSKQSILLNGNFIFTIFII